ncbi:hypothetical protein [Aestuariibaculum marinum]|uniref:Uncharacterized protein n=1 Tax=Aestuariibaculum marinum TaxID=2683592 RepID=A0A8J6Q1B9_9FLAO|nr:hypothetical protein [Aestuariibaculum marinum]MBD0824460.1 hypothetical protein [Aestuariibaculum marinum]
MSYIEVKGDLFQKIWKNIVSVGTWVGVVAGSILMPLPEWGDNTEHSSQIKFILFIATVISGFILVLTYNLKNRITWMLISLLVFLCLICSYFYYNHRINESTLKYYESTIVVGFELIDSDSFVSRKEILNLEKDDLLKAVGGNPSLIWTESSINRNKNILISLLTLNYCLFAVFLVSFTNTVSLYTLGHDK